MKNKILILFFILFAAPSILFSQELKTFTPAGFGIKLQAPSDFSGSPAGDEYIVSNSDIQLAISNLNDQAGSISELEDLLILNGAMTGMESDWNIERIGSDKIPGLNAMKMTGMDDKYIIDVYVLYVPGNPRKCTYVEAVYVGENLRAVVEKIIFSSRPV
ncbi:hypothetical protein DSECCO2_441970 [anaerobic digester metagenome]